MLGAKELLSMVSCALGNLATSNWHDDTTTSGSESYATRCQVLADSTLTSLRWYRVTATSGQHPSALKLYRSDGTLIYTAGSVPDTGAVGWQTHTVATTIA